MQIPSCRTSRCNPTSSGSSVHRATAGAAMRSPSRYVWASLTDLLFFQNARAALVHGRSVWGGGLVAVLSAVDDAQKPTSPTTMRGQTGSNRRCASYNRARRNPTLSGAEALVDDK